MSSKAIENLDAGHKALVKDAKRYRWLRDHGGGIIPAPTGSMVHGNLPYCVMYAPGVRPLCIELRGELLDKIVDQQLNTADTEGVKP